MTREERAELLDRYLDGTLDAEGARRLAQSIREDEEAWQELQVMGLLGEALNDEDPGAFQRGFRERQEAEEKASDFIRRLDERLVERRGGVACTIPRARRRRSSQPMRALPWVAAAAGFAACVLVAVSLSRPAPRVRPAELSEARRSAAPEIVETPRPVIRIPKPDPIPDLERALPPPAPAPTPPLPHPPVPAPPPTPVPAVPTPVVPPTTVEPAAVARLERVQGSVMRQGARAEAGQALGAGEGLETGAGDALAVVRFPDGSGVEIRAATALGPLQDQPAKRITLLRGTLAADVVRQPQGRPMVVATEEAEVQVVGTAFAVTAKEGSTHVEVEKGSVQVVRRSDRRSVRVTDGQVATVAPKTEFVALTPSRFVKGINFNGPAVTIEGRRWISHADALADGLSVFPPDCLTDSKTVAFDPAGDADLSSMLSTCIYMKEASLAFRQRLPNGVYDLYFWEVENLQTGFRSFRIKAEGNVVVRNAGGMVYGKWMKHGPIRVAVGDGSLDVELTHIKGDPSLMGMAIFTAPIRNPR